ncbi:MAG TPA: LLM class F420-dependent oxidoreductase [Acidimicrobiales bacterium]
MIRLGLQIPNFTYPGVDDADLFEAVAGMATAAERAGFDSVWVMDHFYQLAMLGEPGEPMLESYTLLGALAARTTTARLGTLVTGVTYRNPAILAKQVTALDVISRGRAVLGIGAAWFEAEHAALGVAFPPVGERMDRLEEALQICRAMFRDERPTFKGRYYEVDGAINHPAPVQAGGPPILVGGQGEKRTLRLAARYADAVNLTSDRDQIPRKLDVLAKHSAEAGRDPATINKTWLASAIVGSTPAEASERRDTLMRRRGVEWSSLDEATQQQLAARVLVGTPEQLAEAVLEVMGAGLDGVILNFPANGADAAAVAAAGEAIRAALPA